MSGDLGGALELRQNVNEPEERAAQCGVIQNVPENAPAQSGAREEGRLAPSGVLVELLADVLYVAFDFLVRWRQWRPLSDDRLQEIDYCGLDTSPVSR